MRILIFSILLLSHIFCFGQEINQTDLSGKKQGVWKKRHNNGVLRYVGQFKDDQPTGWFKHYYPSGSLNVKVLHRVKDSYASIYYETGELQAIGKYKGQAKDSSWVYYHKNGKTMTEEFYLNGKREGNWKLYYKDGKKAEEKEFSQDLEQGEWKTYYRSGQLKMKATYVNGRLEGEQWYYNTNGRPAVKGSVAKGVRHGFWIYYNPNGTTKKKEEYHYGKRIDEGKDDDVIDDRNILREEQDVLEFEDLFPPR